MNRTEENRKRCKTATPGEWRNYGSKVSCEGLTICKTLTNDHSWADAFFIAKARQDIPYLLSLLDEKDRRIIMADWLEEIENRKKRREADLVFFGCYDLQRDADEEKLIAEVKRLSEENAKFRRYVIEVGCSYTQTESDCECDYEYPWPCDHCPIVEHNRTIDTEMDSEWEIEFIR